MTTISETINENYDRNILLFIFTATLAVLVLVGLLNIFAVIGAGWFLLPLSWWVGGMMVWGYGKYMHNSESLTHARR